MRLKRLSCFIALLLAWFAATSVCWFRIEAASPRVYMENHWLEWCQLGLGGLSSLLFIVSCIHTAVANCRLTYLTLSVISISIVLREFEADALSVAPIWKLFDSSSGWLTVLLWALLGWGWLHRPVEPIDAAAEKLARRAGGLALAGIFMYAAGWPFDRLHWAPNGIPAMFVEELMEFHAASLLLLAAASRWWVRRKRLPQGDVQPVGQAVPPEVIQPAVASHPA